MAKQQELITSIVEMFLKVNVKGLKVKSLKKQSKFKWIHNTYQSIIALPSNSIPYMNDVVMMLARGLPLPRKKRTPSREPIYLIRDKMNGETIPEGKSFQKLANFTMNFFRRGPKYLVTKFSIRKTENSKFSHAALIVFEKQKDKKIDVQIYDPHGYFYFGIYMKQYKHLIEGFMKHSPLFISKKRKKYFGIQAWSFDMVGYCTMFRHLWFYCYIRLKMTLGNDFDIWNIEKMIYNGIRTAFNKRFVFPSDIRYFIMEFALCIIVIYTKIYPYLKTILDINIHSDIIDIVKQCVMKRTKRTENAENTKCTNATNKFKVMQKGKRAYLNKSAYK